MKYLSWDVGVKNMAFALLEKNNDICILKRTGILNLIDKRETCSIKLRTGKECGKIARHKLLNKSLNEICVCKSHCEKNKIIPIETDKFKCIKCGSDSSINILSKDEWSWCEKHSNLSKKY